MLSEFEIYIIFLILLLIIGYCLGRLSSVYREMDDQYKLLKYDDLKQENENLKRTIKILKGNYNE